MSTGYSILPRGSCPLKLKWRRLAKRCLVLAIAILATLQLVWIIAGYRSFINPSTVVCVKPRAVRVSTPLNQSIPVPTGGPPIIVWWDSVYSSVDVERICSTSTCRVTSNRSLQSHPDTQAFLFYASHFKPFQLPFPRKPNHIWALMHEESPRNVYMLSHEPTMEIFNFTSSYNRKSDYPITTQWLQCPHWVHDTKYVLPLVDKNRLRKSGLAPILYIQSDCDVPSDRDNFVQLLLKHIRVDSYGPCINNKKMPDKFRFHENMAALDDAGFLRFAARYKFTLAMENYICNDYVTEKVWRPLRLGSVPIVFSAPNIRDYLPSNKSAILVSDFLDVEDLARYIHLLDTNDRLYRQYVQNKDEPITNTLLLQLLQHRDWLPEHCSSKPDKQTQTPRPLYDSIFVGYECFICDKVTALSRDERDGLRPKAHKANSSHYMCPSPRQFDEDGRYSVHSDAWSAEWTYGKYEAEVLDGLYSKEETMSEAEYHSRVKQAYQDDTSTKDIPPHYQ